MSLLSPCLDRGHDPYSEVAVAVASNCVSNPYVLKCVLQINPTFEGECSVSTC